MLWVQRASPVAFGRTEVARDQKDVVEIVVVVETGDPRLVWGAAEGRGAQAEYRDDQRGGHDEPVRIRCLRHRLPWHPD
jgi:hypothetical protein